MPMTSMKSSRQSAWILSMGLAVLCGCQSEVNDKPAADPLDDPWVDAIDTGDSEPAAAGGTEAVPSAEPNAGSQDALLAVAETGSLPEAQPPKDEAEPTTATSHAPAGSSKATAVPPAAPEQPTGETPAVDEQPADPAPAPVADPAPAPSAEPAKPASPPPITVADFHGNYRYIGGSAQRADLAAAIDVTVKQLNRAIQGIARKRLTQANPVDNSVEIVIAGDKITTTFESGFSVTCVIDGPSVNTTGNEGEKLAVRVRSKGSKIVQVLQGKDGARTIVYVLSADRKKLTVHHKITADRLPEPLTFRLSYSRK